MLGAHRSLVRPKGVGRYNFRDSCLALVLPPFKHEDFCERHSLTYTQSAIENATLSLARQCH